MFNSRGGLFLLLLGVCQQTGISFGPICDEMDFQWHDLTDHEQFRNIMEGWSEDYWDNLGSPLRWYYGSKWADLHPDRQKGLRSLGWDNDTWWQDLADPEHMECVYTRPLVELRPWSRLLPEEQEAAASLGFDQYTWHTKEFAMTAWQPKDLPAEIQVCNIPQQPAVLLPNNGFYPIKLTLNIPELDEVTWEDLEESDTRVWVDDPDDEGTIRLNDEMKHRLEMPMSDFIEGIEEGKKYYVKYENNEDLISEFFDGIDPGQIIAEYLEGTEVGNVARVGHERSETIFQHSQFYVGGEMTTTHCHLDLQAFNFLYVAHGKKRVRLLPNDQRTASNFTWGLEAFYSVWPGYDLLNADPMPTHAVEMTLGPGEGVMIPYYTWHAVENIEPSIAYGMIREFPGTRPAKWGCDN